MFQRKIEDIFETIFLFEAAAYNRIRLFLNKLKIFKAVFRNLSLKNF